ncbi:MAG TPA: hypothetical protein VLF94_04110 [Chlamydiales bacterium]|nr:hypothetical protein [Chlamydiales bacterium]
MRNFSVCLLLLFALPLFSEVYDCFIFFNELEVLEIRFHELYDKVDHFVLVESAETFRGNPKPYYFLDHKERFAKFLDKVIHVCVEERLDVSSSWTRETFQRDQIMRGLQYCCDTDVILISDADEIPRPDAISQCVEILERREVTNVAFDLDLYYFYLNMRSGGIWLGTTAALFGELKQYSPDLLRDRARKENPRTVIAEGGWHLTYMGGETRNIAKIESFSHGEFDTPAFKNQMALMDKLCDGCFLVNIDSTYPRFVLENIPLMEKWGFILPLDEIDLQHFLKEKWVSL